MKNKEIEEKLKKLLREYHHYKFMNQGLINNLIYGYKTDMKLFDFMQWLESRED